MAQSNLKKEFSKSTVTRMRNLITGKLGDKTQLQSGYEKKRQEYTEGSVWEDSGKVWTIKNGIKQTMTKMDSLKKLVVLPLVCPCCKKPMKVNEYNKKMYSIHNKCFDCVIEEETAIRISGNWDEYVSIQRNANKNASLQDFEKAVESWMAENDSFISEAGDVENWTSVDKTKIYNQIKIDIEKAKQQTI